MEPNKTMSPALTNDSFQVAQVLNSSQPSLSVDMNSTESDHYMDYFDMTVRAHLILSQPYYIIALILGAIGILANLTSLAAIYQIRRSMTSHFRILISLIASDLLVAVSMIGHITNTVMYPMFYPGIGTWGYRLSSRCSFMTIKAFNTTGLNITLLNLMAMAIDHYIAILKPFRLNTWMSKKRTVVMIATIWIIAFLSGFSDFFSPLNFSYEAYNGTGTIFNWCEIIWITPYQEEYITFAIVVVCFVSMLYMYLHIYCEVKGKHYSDTLNSLKAHRNKRALRTTLLILGTFIFCWLPICIFNIVMIILIKKGLPHEALSNLLPFLAKVDKYLYDLILLNTICDPIIYAVRMNEVRRGYFLLLAKCHMGNYEARAKWRRYSSACLHLETTFLTDEARKISMSGMSGSLNSDYNVSHRVSFSSKRDSIK